MTNSDSELCYVADSISCDAWSFEFRDTSLNGSRSICDERMTAKAALDMPEIESASPVSARERDSRKRSRSQPLMIASRSRNAIVAIATRIT